jgi:hypothetical protein
VARPDVNLRLIQAADDLKPVVLLTDEYSDWVRGRVLTEYGINLEFESEQDLFLDLAHHRLTTGDQKSLQIKV